MSRPTLELQLIVRNGASTLARCLRSAAPFVDRITLGDTGSTDGTRAVGARFGARIFPLAWQRNFALARNQVLAHASCDWILVLDADEMLDPEEAGRELPALLANPALHAYGLWRRNYLTAQPGEPALSQPQPNTSTLPEAHPYPTFTPSFHVRLFRPSPGIQWEYPVHESVTESVDRLRLPRASAPLLIHHFGYVEDTPETRRRKVETYHQLGLRRLADHPGDFESYLQLAICELQQRGRPAEACTLLQQAARLAPTDGRIPLYLGIALLRLERPAEARTSLLHAHALGESTFTLHNALGDACLLLAAHPEAASAFRHAATLTPEPSRTLAKLGLAEVHLGDAPQGLSRIRQALARHPASAPLHSLLALAETVAAAPASHPPKPCQAPNLINPTPTRT